ncbi:MAG TPA: aminotransferase class V-fold PLP-dependent enzyme [Thermoanaerobaculia bacterium]|nr:aminotransferase class V-fold PLP-dependent enzyme [Thermoanaerobaculia bacterium]
MISKILLRREQFPSSDHLVYFNHAAVGPLSQSCTAAIEGFLREQRDFGALHWRDWYAEYIDLREEAAVLLGADASEISILKNTSEGLSFVAGGLDWKPGDNVVIPDIEFPSNSVPWRRLESRGVECRLLPAEKGEFTAEELSRLFDERTRLVSLSSVAFHNGFRPDLVAIGNLCRSAGVLFCVDGIQSLGALQIDVKEAKIDFLAADGHKWLLSPEGAAIFYCSESARDRLTPTEWGWMNVARGSRMIGCSIDPLPDGRRFEAGAINTAGVYGLRASIALLRHVGMDNVEREVIWATQTLAAALEDLGFVVRSPRPLRSGILACDPPQDVDVARLGQLAGSSGPDQDVVSLLHRWLEQSDVICSVREGMLRFSPHFYNDEEDIERVRDVLAEVV